MTTPANPSRAHTIFSRIATRARVQNLAAFAYPVVTALAFPQRVAGIAFDFGLLCAWLSPLLLLLALRGLAPRAAALRAFWLGLFANAAILYFIAHTVVTYGHASLWLGALAPFGMALYAASTTALFGAGAALLARAQAGGARDTNARASNARASDARATNVARAAFTARMFCSPVLGAFALAALWTALDHLRSFALGGFPWGTLGYAQHENALLLGLAPWLGVYGLSFVTVLCAALCVLPSSPATFARELFTRWNLSPAAAGTAHKALRVAAALLLCHALGWWLAPPPLAGPSLRVAVLQGNIAQGVKWAPDWGARTLARYEELARRAAAGGAQLIVFPETALPGTLDVASAARAPAAGTFRARVEALARETGAALVVGAVGISPAPAPAREQYALFDSAYVFSPTGALGTRYDKTHLVPFGEYLPLRALLERFVRPLATGMARRDLTAGPAPRALEVMLPAPPAAAPATEGVRAPAVLRFGAPICYELLFPNLVRRMTKDGAQLLLGMTNDAWYGATGAPYQFLAMTALRAAENGVPLARAANTGISAFVSARGRVQERTEIFESAVLFTTLRLPEAARAPTFYAQHGDLFAFACWLFAASFWSAALWRNRARPRQHHRRTLEPRP